MTEWFSSMYIYTLYVYCNYNMDYLLSRSEHFVHL